MKLNKEEKERYSRHLRIPEFTEVAQKKLLSGSILIIGAGGLGSPISLYLAAAGVGKIGIADFDKVERHNLQRQILFEDAHIGMPKADLARERLLSLNPGIEVKLHREGITPDNAREIFSQYDIIVDGSDNFDTRYLTNDATYLEKKPLVYGSVFQLEGQVMVLNDKEQAPCYRCLFPEPPEPGQVPNCNEAGVVGALCGVVGSLQAMEAIKLLSGVGKVQSGKLLKVDVLNSRFPSIQLVKDPECPLCGNKPTIQSIENQNYTVPCIIPDTAIQDDLELPIEMDILEAHKIKDDNTVFLDIREPSEAQICQIRDSLFIPMGKVPESIHSIPKNKTIIVYCHHGIRSLRVVSYLRDAGLKNVTSLKGGIDSWAIHIDQTIERY